MPSPSTRLTALTALCALLAGGAARADAEAERRGFDLWPLVVWNDEERTVLYPLFVHEPDLTLVGPVYAATRDGRDHHVLWPLLKVSDGRLERAAPFWFSDSAEEFTFVPFVHQTRRGTLWLLPPMWFARDGSYAAVFPFYVRQHGAEREKLSVLWPLYARRTSRDADGDVRERSRRFLIFRDTLEDDGSRRLHLLGLPVWERTS